MKGHDMDPKDEWKLARIESAFLGIEDHGCLTYNVVLVYADPGERIGGASQGFGGRVLWNKTHGGTRASIALIAELLVAVGVDAWKNLPGKMVWVQADWNHAHRIKGLDTGVTFDPAETIARVEGEMDPGRGSGAQKPHPTPFVYRDSLGEHRLGPG